MIPRVRFGNTGLEVTRIGLGGFPFGGVNGDRLRRGVMFADRGEE